MDGRFRSNRLDLVRCGNGAQPAAAAIRFYRRVALLARELGPATRADGCDASNKHIFPGVAAAAEQLQVVELVAASADEGDPVAYLEPVGGADAKRPLRIRAPRCQA